METIRLLSADDSWYPAFEHIYSASFPVFEQRTRHQQQLAFASARYHLDGYVEDGRLVGFAAYWVWDTYIYVEHYAMHPDCRGKGYGKLLLGRLMQTYRQRLILEIDPVVDPICEKRLRFYQSLGFASNAFHHIHPAYREGFAGHELVVLSTAGVLTEEEYARFAGDLQQTVMAFSGNS